MLKLTNIHPLIRCNGGGAIHSQNLYVILHIGEKYITWQTCKCQLSTYTAVGELTEWLDCAAEVGEIVKFHTRTVEEVRSSKETSHPLWTSQKNTRNSNSHTWLKTDQNYGNTVFLTQGRGGRVLAKPKKKQGRESHKLRGLGASLWCFRICQHVRRQEATE